MLKYSNDLIAKDTDDNSLSHNLLDNDLLGNNSLIYINCNINIDIKVKSNLDKNMIDDNLLEENFEIKI